MAERGFSKCVSQISRGWVGWGLGKFLKFFVYIVHAGMLSEQKKKTDKKS